MTIRQFINHIAKKGKSIRLYNNRALVNYKNFTLKVTFREEEQDAEIQVYYESIKIDTCYMDDFELYSPISTIKEDSEDD